MTGDVRRLAIPPSPQAPGLARAEVQGLGDRLEPDLLERVVQLTSELVSASVRTAELAPAAEVALTIELQRDRVRVEVGGAARGLTGDPLEQGIPRSLDWSLYFVAQLADRWGVERATATAWFEIDREGGAAPGVTEP